MNTHYVVVKFEDVGKQAEFVGTYKGGVALQGFLLNFNDAAQHSVEPRTLPGYLSEGVATVWRVWDHGKATNVYVLELS